MAPFRIPLSSALYTQIDPAATISLRSALQTEVHIDSCDAFPELAMRMSLASVAACDFADYIHYSIIKSSSQPPRCNSVVSNSSGKYTYDSNVNVDVSIYICNIGCFKGQFD
jgi:hypothetical protein